MSRFLAIDFETADYKADSACALGLVRVENGVITQEHSRLIRPPRERVIFSSIHGLYWKDLRDQPSFQDLWPEFKPYFEDIDFIVAHNSGFDRKVLLASCEAAAVTAPTQAFKCTVQAARKILQITPAKLSNVCTVLGIDLNHHEALSDARACAQIMIRAMASENFLHASPTPLRCKTILNAHT